MDEDEILDELESDAEGLEKELGQVDKNRENDALREKHERAEELLEEIHGQLEFLREVVEDSKE